MPQNLYNIPQNSKLISSSYNEEQESKQKPKWFYDKTVDESVIDNICSNKALVTKLQRTTENMNKKNNTSMN